MIWLRHPIPLDYRLCCQTVTVYHRDGSRQVYQNAYLDRKRSRRSGSGRTDRETSFTLVIPGAPDIAPGDKVLAGEGPEPDEGFAALTPAALSGLGIVETVSQKFWQGQPCHLEARG